MQKIACFLLHQATAAKKTSNRVSSTTRLAQDTWNFHQKVGRGLMVFHHATDRSVGRIHQQHTPPVSWSTMPSQRSVLMYWTGRNFWFVIFLCIHGLSFLGKFASRWHGDMEGTWYLASVCCNSSSFVALLQVKLGEGTWWRSSWWNDSTTRRLSTIDDWMILMESLFSLNNCSNSSRSLKRVGFFLSFFLGKFTYTQSQTTRINKTTHKYMRVYVCKYASWAGFWCSKTLWFSGVSESKVNQAIPNMKHMDPPNLLSQHLSTRLITTVSWSIRTSHGNIRRTRFAARSHCSHRKQRSFCLENMTMWQ